MTYMRFTKIKKFVFACIKLKPLNQYNLTGIIKTGKEVNGI